MRPFDDVLKANAERFSGFAGAYDSFRPQPPLFVTHLLLRYLEGHVVDPSVADVGCGTGLSTYLWDGIARAVFGIDPNLDMLKTARGKLASLGKRSPILFIRAPAHSTGLKAGSVDIVTCSQSFHWMEPASTLAEFNRILRTPGIFAAYDCDWPPSVDWRAEQAFLRLFETVDRASEVPAGTGAHRWHKAGHLERLSASGYFAFTREILFHNVERCSGRRFIGLALSQGSLQTLLKRGYTEASLGLDRFRGEISECFGPGEKEMVVSYRLRMGIKER